MGGGLAKVPPYLIGYPNERFIFLYRGSNTFNRNTIRRRNALMGDRTNYTIVTTDNPDQNINIYAHWDGTESVSILQHALTQALPRIAMGDTSYATRIIVDQLTKHGRDSETGFGIYIGSEIETEEEHEYKEVNLINRTVTVGQMKFEIDKFCQVLT